MCRESQRDWGLRGKLADCLPGLSLGLNLVGGHPRAWRSVSLRFISLALPGETRPDGTEHEFWVPVCLSFLSIHKLFTNLLLWIMLQRKVTERVAGAEDETRFRGCVRYHCCAHAAAEHPEMMLMVEVHHSDPLSHQESEVEPPWSSEMSHEAPCIPRSLSYTKYKPSAYYAMVELYIRPEVSVHSTALWSTYLNLCHLSVSLRLIVLLLHPREAACACAWFAGTEAGCSKSF